jgi:osomolarity two-component system sensor histidine kinase NIK1
LLIRTIAVKWCFDNGIHSGVTTPLSAQDLASVLIPAFESTPVAPTNDVKFDVLFAENNLVIQKLVVKILSKYGHKVDIVENESLAVDAFKARALQNRPFDIIFLRMARLCSSVHDTPQMNDSLPIMDGMEVTELIRAYETHNNLTPTPIIAVTAHTGTYSFHDKVAVEFVRFRATFSVIGDRERFLNAGMVRYALLFI